jgi:opacity protein-like surface antigen
MRTHFLTFVLATAFLFSALTPSLALDLGGHDRDGVVVGFNIGAGWNWLNFAIPDEEGNKVAGKTDTEVDLTGGITLGWARSDHLVASIGVHGWKARYWFLGNQLSASTTQFQADIAWFPRGEGFWLRGGIGPGNISFSAVIPEANVTFQKWGWNLLGGAGYEFRASDSAAIGVAYEYRHLGVGAFEGLEDTKISSHNALLSIRWYME